MKKALKKLLSIILLVGIMCIALTACADPEDIGGIGGDANTSAVEELNNQEADETKAQLYI